MTQSVRRGTLDLFGLDLRVEFKPYVGLHGGRGAYFKKQKTHQ